MQSNYKIYIRFNSSFPFHMKTSDWRDANKKSTTENYDMNDPEQLFAWFNSQTIILNSLMNDLSMLYNSGFQETYPTVIEHIKGKGNKSYIINETKENFNNNEEDNKSNDKK